MHRRNLITMFTLAAIAASACLWQAYSARYSSPNSVVAATNNGEEATQVVTADWTTAELPAGKWVSMSQQSLADEAERYVELNKSHIQLINFQDFQGSSAACATTCTPSGGCGGGLGGGRRLGGGLGCDSFNVNSDCDRADGMWNSYCEPGLPGLPAQGPGGRAGLTCLQCGPGGCGSSCGMGGAPVAFGPAACGPMAGGIMPAAASCGPAGCGAFGMPQLPQGPIMAGLTAPAANAGCALASFDTGQIGTDMCGPECGSRRRITGVDSATCVKSGEPCWNMRGPIPWEMFAQGEYVGPHRLRHTDKYRMRVDDQLTLVYRVTREISTQAYQMNVGDQLRLESAQDDKVLDRELVIQPDGTITTPLVGQVMAAGRTADEIRQDLEKRYLEYYNEPAITVTPLQVNTKLEDLRATVDSRAGNGGQTFQVTIAPDGTIQLPGLGSVPAHGMTLEELNMEVNARYSQIVTGIEVTAVLTQRAPRFIYIVGEVGQPGRVELVGPTTVIQAIALAQGWNNGANLRNIVVFRRAEDWRLLATKVDVQGALYGTRPAPSDEIWLRDSDIVIVPKTPIRVIDDAIELIFTNGLYAAAPFLSDPVIFTDASNL